MIFPSRDIYYELFNKWINKNHKAERSCGWSSAAEKTTFRIIELWNVVGQDYCWQL